MNTVLIQNTNSVVEATGLVRRYGEGETSVHALRGVDLGIARGQLTAVMGGRPESWAPRFLWTYSIPRGASTLAGWDPQGNPRPTRELQAYVNPLANALNAGHSPFVQGTGGFTIRAQPRPEALAATSAQVSAGAAGTW